MEFGIEKWAMLLIEIEKGKIVKSVGIELPGDKVFKPLQDGESYKYLEVLKADRFSREDMKLKVSKEYFRRLKKSFEVKVEWWEFSSRSQYLGSVPFKIFSSIY